MRQFDHERFRVYNASLDPVKSVHLFLEQVPPGRGYLVDQLRRAVSSIPLNIAEGAGEFSRADKARFYRFAKRSATECAAVLDVFTATGGCNELLRGQCRSVLLEIVSMLVALCKQCTGGTDIAGAAYRGVPASLGDPVSGNGV